MGEIEEARSRPLECVYALTLTWDGANRLGLDEQRCADQPDQLPTLSGMLAGTLGGKHEFLGSADQCDTPGKDPGWRDPLQLRFFNLDWYHDLLSNAH